MEANWIKPALQANAHVAHAARKKNIRPTDHCAIVETVFGQDFF